MLECRLLRYGISAGETAARILCLSFAPPFSCFRERTLRKYLLIDGNNLLHAAQGAKKLTVGGTEVQAIYGFLRTMRALVSTYSSFTPIVLWDGASWRNMLHPEYKATREKNHTPSYQKALAEKQTARKQMPAIKKGMTLLGIDQVHALNMEGDDLAAILGDRFVDRGDQVILVSGDKDWVQLVRPGMIWFDPINERKIRKPEDCEQVIGIPVADMRQFVEIKAMMGDAGDNVPPMGGIGAKGAIEFMRVFGSWANFSNMAIDGTLQTALEQVDKKFHAAFLKAAEDEDKRIAFAANLKLVDLRTTARPAPVNLTVTKGEPDIERFRKFCQVLVFRSILQNLEEWVVPFPAWRVPFDGPYVENAA